MKKNLVTYQGGPSRYHPTQGIDYMLCIVDIDGEEIELYAEAGPDPADERGTYTALRAEILAQAALHRIPTDTLNFA